MEIKWNRVGIVWASFVGAATVGADTEAMPPVVPGGRHGGEAPLPEAAAKRTPPRSTGRRKSFESSIGGTR